MNKLQLRLDDLRVDSFETLPDAAERGTVLGNRAISDSTCFQDICTCDPTQGDTCNGGYTCATCAGTCQSCAETCVAPCVWCGVETDPPACPA